MCRPSWPSRGECQSCADTVAVELLKSAQSDLVFAMDDGLFVNVVVRSGEA